MQKTNIYRALIFFCTTLMVFFGLTMLVIARKLVHFAYTDYEGECHIFFHDLHEIENLLPSMITPLIIMVIFSVYGKRYEVHPFLWYCLCLMCTYMLITGTTIFIEYLLYKGMTKHACVYTDLSVSIFNTACILMATLLDFNFYAYMSGTVFLAMCFILRMFWRKACLRKRLFIGLSLVCYLLVCILMMMYVRNFQKMLFYNILDGSLGIACAFLSFACFLVDKHLVKNIQNERNQNEVLSDEKYEVINLNTTVDTKDCGENTPCNQ